MPKLVIEEINRLGHITNRHVFNSLPIAVGRAYHNDLILSDVHVSPEHLVVREDGEAYAIEDKDSHNGIKYRLHSPESKPGRLVSGDDIIIGRTRLRLVSPWHPVPDTHLLPSKTSVSRLLARPGVAILVVAFAIVVMLAEANLESRKDVGFVKLLAFTLPTLVVITIWGGIWTFVGRVITHRANFLPHAIAATLFMIFVSTITTISHYMTYNLNDVLLSSIFEFVFIGMAGVMLLYINLTNSTNINQKTRFHVSHGVTWSVLLIGMFLQYTAQPDFRPSPSFPAIIKPPFAKLAPSQSVDSFLRNSEFIFQHASEE